jgi:hypothetical protein
MFITRHAPADDVCATLMRMVHFARCRRFRDSVITVVPAVLMWAVSTTVWAGHLSWHEYSESYEIHLGVVPASVADRDSALIQMHETAPHGIVKRTEALRHVMVAIFRRPGHERVLDADVSAEVIEKDLIHTRRERKNLDVMMLPNGESYCNFFTLHWNGLYQIKVRVSEPGRETEWLVFEQEERNLSY